VGSRGEFVPAAVCRQLVALQDQVPPMPPPLVRSILARELHPRSLQDVFYDIDLDSPLGSASIAQARRLPHPNLTFTLTLALALTLTLTLTLTLSYTSAINPNPNPKPNHNHTALIHECHQPSPSP